MPRILIAECKQEVSTFNPHLSGYDDFQIRKGADLLRHHRAARYEVGGALQVFELESGLELVPGYSAVFITSNGPLEESAWHRLSSEFLDTIKENSAVDGVYLSMHGAMSSENELDPEGHLIAETRRLVGNDVPIVVSLDLHGIVTDRMIQNSDLVVGYHTYPHVDFFETGERAARLLIKLLNGDVRPVTAKVAIPALVRGDELVTSNGLFGRVIDRAKEIESGPDGLSAGLFIGNPFTDVPELQTYSLVVMDGDREGAIRSATELAQQFWVKHERMHMSLTSLEEMSRIALESKQGTLGLVDAADATSSGASGDSAAILHQLIESNYPGRVLAPIVDAPSVKAAIEAGIGNEVTTTIGGSVDPRFKPLPIKARVRLLSDGRFQSESFGDEWIGGDTAVLEVGSMIIVASSRAVNLYDRSFFYAHGQDPKRFDAVVIKAPHCEEFMYSDWCSRMIYVDAPGSTSANLKSLGHTRCPRPIFPLDSDVIFVPQAKTFQRPKYSDSLQK